MKIIEKILLTISILGLCLRLFSVEGGVFLSTLSFMLLSLFYLFFGFLLFNEIPWRGIFKNNSYKAIKWKRLLWSVTVGLVFAIVVPGVLFALNKWMGAPIILSGGLILLSPVFIINLILYICKSSKFYSSILIRSGILLTTGFILLYRSVS